MPFYQRLSFLWVAVCLLLQAGWINLTDAAVCQDYVVDLGATISTNPAPQIKLDWASRLLNLSGDQTLYRRLKGAGSWTTLATLASNVVTYTDNAVSTGVEYEYWLQRNLYNDLVGEADGYLSAGINVPFVENRGKIILLVDTTMTNALAAEIAQLQQDLTGDGWTVLRHDLARMAVDPATTNSSVWASRSNELAAVKATIKADYNADTANVKAVYILGHLPVPYSGDIAPDGHGNHYGAWPADGFYGDMDGNWTDSFTLDTVAADKRNWNDVGDGKFDQDYIPSDLELQVGRVDLANMTKFPSAGATETDLLRRYLRKAHQYRQREGALANIARRGMVREGFGVLGGSEPFSATGWGTIYSCLGRTNTTWDAILADTWFDWAGTNTYLFGYGNGGGNYEGASTVGASSDFGQQPSKVVFTSLFGSYFGDWDHANDFLRAPLAGNASGDSFGLTCFWSGRPSWFLHHMGMGETVGYAHRLSANNPGYANGYEYSGSSARGIHMGLMGDPSLRFYPVMPPQNLVAASASSAVGLGWDASTETNLLGYHVYRSANPLGPFTRLTSSPLATPSYTDSGVTAGSTYTYMVRTLKLETVPGGSFQNLSQGAFATITASSAATSVPWNPSSLQATVAAANQIVLTWHDNSIDETGFRIERHAVGGNYTTLTTVSANATNYTDAGPLPAGGMFYYRVIAVGPGGDSVPSNEAAVNGAAGFVDFPTPIMHVDKLTGAADVPVRRVGGNIGAIGYTYWTSNSSAIAGTHFTGQSNTMVWVDGASTQQVVHVPLLSDGQPQLPRSFKVYGKQPTGGASMTQSTNTLVLIEDPSATLAAPWQSTLLGTVTDSGPAVSAEGVIGDSIYGGGIATADDLRFIYQVFTNDAVLTAKIESPSPLQTAARFGVMVRSNLVRQGPWVGVQLPGDTTGSKLGNRSADWGTVAWQPSASNSNKPPYWVRLTRIGNTFTGESSSNGTDWVVLGSVTQTMQPAAYWGLFHYTSQYAGDFQLARFSNVTIASANQPPTAPTNLTAAIGGPTFINLAWSAAQYASQIRVERSLSGGAFGLLTNLTGAAVSYTDAALTGANSYGYRVRAENNSGTSVWSNVSTVLAQPSLAMLLTTLSGVLDPNDCNTLTCVVTNSGINTASNLTATLTSTMPGVTIVQPTSSYPNTAPGQTATNALAFRIDTAPTVPCATSIPFTLALTYTGGSTNLAFSLATSTSGYALTQSTGAIVPGTTNLGNHTDDGVSTISLPFNYTFYGQTYSNAWASSNGNLQFGSASTAYSSTPLPASGFGPTIFAFWDDLTTSTAGDGIFTSTSGSAPNRIFNCEWRAHTLTGNFPVNFEVRLYENQQRFDLVYGVMSNFGDSATVGVQKDATVYSQYSYNTASVSNGVQLTCTMLSTCPDGGGRCDTDGNGIPDWWMFQNFGHTDSQAGDKSRPLDAPAGDGIPNLIKYALGINALTSGYQGHLVTGTTNITGQTYLMLTYTRPEPVPTGLTYTPEAGSDIGTWSGSETVPVSSVNNGNGTSTITIRDQFSIADRPKRFIHLKVGSTP